MECTKLKIALYARVSTEGQDPEVQLQALRAHAAQRGWDIVEEFVDHGYSGAKEKRPALDRMMKAAWSGKFKAVFVWRFDRFARSLKHLVTALEQFRSLNIQFISLQEQIDTSTPLGNAMYAICGAMAQLERDIIRERVMAGLKEARRRGVRLGRPVAEAQSDEVAELKQQGFSVSEIGKRLGCSRSTVKRRLREVVSGVQPA
jgi:DNA invertase Pin-like site-specific DNA recombinase